MADYVPDLTCIVRKEAPRRSWLAALKGEREFGESTVICGRATVEQYLRCGYVFDWPATDAARHAALTPSPCPGDVGEDEQPGDCLRDELLNIAAICEAKDLHVEAASLRSTARIVSEQLRKAQQSAPLPATQEDAERSVADVELIEGLRRQAKSESQVSREMAEDKSRRQSDNPTGECVYAWVSPEQTLSWKAADRLAALAHPAQATPSALSGDAGEVEPFPGCYADLQQRRVTTLAKLGLMLSVMASGDAPEVVGYDAAELYAEVLMALAIEDAEDTDIALEIARDHPEADILAGHRISCPPVTEEAEKVAAWLEQYPSPMNDLDMAMRIRQICARIRAGEHRKSDATPSGEGGEGKPNGVAENKAGGLWYRRWYTARTRVNELEALLANPPKHKFWGAGEPDCPREIKAPNGELHTLRCKVCGLDNPRNDLCRAALPSHQGAGE